MWIAMVMQLNASVDLSYPRLHMALRHLIEIALSRAHFFQVAVRATTPQ